MFQDRYKSTLIQEDPYLPMSIVYVLLNPVRARIADNPYDYRWSSLGEYFSGNKDNIVDANYVEDILQSKEVLDDLLREWAGKELPIKKTSYGSIIGSEQFGESSLERFNRRKKEGSVRRMRKDDYTFKSPEEVINDFEQEKGIKISNIRLDTFKGKQLRSELLVPLKDSSGLKYKEIMDYPLFKSLKYSSLGKLYRRAKETLEGNR